MDTAIFHTSFVDCTYILKENLALNPIISMHVARTPSLQLQVAQLSLEDAGQGSITLKTYFKYFLLGSGYVLFAIMCALFLVSQVSNGKCRSEVYCVNVLYLHSW